MTYVTLSSSQVAAKAPVDEQLMQQIKDNEDDLNARLLLTKAFPYQFKLNGPLNIFPTGDYRRIDGVLPSIATTFTDAKLYLEKPGTGGTLDVDVLRFNTPNTPITAIACLFNASINTIARAGSSLSTQSVTRSTAQISTQTITDFKASVNVSSIVLLGSNLVRYNLASAIDSDYVVGDSFVAASCSNALNNGTFVIVRVGDDGGNNVVVTNASGVAQSGAAGNIKLLAFSYNFSNPVSSQFAAGEVATFASHTSGVNDGALTIYAINSGGNNIIVKHTTGATQGGAAGNVNVNRWIFAQSSAVSTTDYVVGEKILAASHTSGSNDGNFTITAVNSGGNNVIVYNPSGVVQGGAAGTINTNRWVIFFSSDPAANVTAGDSVVVASATNALNDGTFTAKQVDRTTSDNIVVYNESGVAQGGAGGTLKTSKVKVSFASDQSAVYSTDSIVEIFGSPSSGMDAQALPVVQVNRGGGGNYNIVVECTAAVEGAGNAGRVIWEGRSIFSTRPSLTLATSVTNATNRHGQVSSNAVFNAYATVASGQLLAMVLKSIPNGHPENIVLSLI